MKRLAIILTLVTLTFATAGWSLFWLAECTGHVAETLETASTLSERDPQAALEEMEQLQEYWERSEPKIGLFVHEGLLLDMNEKLEECAALLRHGKTGEFQMKAELAAATARNLLRQQLPNLENIL